MVKVALWYGQSGALVGQSGALGHQSGTLVWSKWRFVVMQAHIWWTLKNDSSSLANSETKAPSKCLSKCLSICTFMSVIKSVQSLKNVNSLSVQNTLRSVPISVIQLHLAKTVCLLLIFPIPRHDSPSKSCCDRFR